MSTSTSPLVLSQGGGGQRSQAVFIPLQESTTWGKGAVEAGGKPSDVSGDIGHHARSGLVVVRNLKEMRT